MKPDLVAPGERIVSCATMDPTKPDVAPFKEDSGTSMAAPHVSGVAAAFLSVRQEFIGRPDIRIDGARDAHNNAANPTVGKLVAAVLQA